MKLDPTYAIKLLRPSRQGKDVCQRTLSEDQAERVRPVAGREERMTVAADPTPDIDPGLSTLLLSLRWYGIAAEVEKVRQLCGSDALRYAQSVSSAEAYSLVTVSLFWAGRRSHSERGKQQKAAWTCHSGLRPLQSRPPKSSPKSACKLFA